MLTRYYIVYYSNQDPKASTMKYTSQKFDAIKSEIISKNKNLLYPILSNKGDLNIDFNKQINFDRDSKFQDDLRASLNEHIFDLITPDLTNHIIDMTVKKLNKGVKEDDLIKYA